MMNMNMKMNKRMKMKMQRTRKMLMGGKGTKTSSTKTVAKIHHDIYFRLSDGKWYAIKSSWWCFSSSSSSSNWGHELPKSLEPALPPIPAPIERPEFASIGSKIYASGGLDRSPELMPSDDYLGRSLFPSEKVFCFDTCSPEEGWKEAPPMNKKRMYHYMLADAGKIYVLGGLNRPIPHSANADADGKQQLLFAEVYDPNSGDAWQELAHIQGGDDMTVPLTISGHAIVQEGQQDNFSTKKILFHSYYSQNLFCLHTTLKDCVGVYDNKFPQYMPSSAFLDGTLYFLHRDDIFAYDIPSGGGCGSLHPKLVVLHNVGTFSLPSRGCFDFEYESRPTGCLLSLGNSYLALIWARVVDFEVFLDVHFSILKMSKKGNTFEGKFLACSTYTVRGGTLEGCMAVAKTPLLPQSTRR